MFYEKNIIKKIYENVCELICDEYFICFVLRISYLFCVSYMKLHGIWMHSGRFSFRIGHFVKNCVRDHSIYLLIFALFATLANFRSLFLLGIPTKFKISTEKVQIPPLCFQNCLARNPNKTKHLIMFFRVFNLCFII